MSMSGPETNMDKPHGFILRYGSHIKSAENVLRQACHAVSSDGEPRPFSFIWREGDDKANKVADDVVGVIAALQHADPSIEVLPQFFSGRVDIEIKKHKGLYPQAAE